MAAQGASSQPAPQRRWNVAPTQSVWGLRRDPEAKAARVTPFCFGLYAAQRRLVINARAESVSERPLFRPLLPRGRVLVAASAFYEWAQPTARGERKVPWCFARSDARPFWLAALAREEGETPGCVLLTTAANPTVAAVHPRMPVMLEADQARMWLAGDTSVEQALTLLVPYAPPMRAWPVTTLVNNPRDDSPACIDPASPLQRPLSTQASQEP